VLEILMYGQYIPVSARRAPCIHPPATILLIPDLIQPTEQKIMNNIAVVYHSGYGHTAEQAKAVLRGAQAAPDTNATLIAVSAEGKIEDAQWDVLNQADAIVFGCPTYMGSASAQFKTFMDASSKMWFEQKWKDKIAAGFTNSASQSGDKLSTLTQLAIFAAQHSMIWVGTGLMPGNNNSKGSVEDLNHLGSFLGAMAQSNADQGPEAGPIASDLRTAEHLGRRVAETTARFKRGA
jgi:multimeric flavodoxin WrbA